MLQSGIQCYCNRMDNRGKPGVLAVFIGIETLWFVSVTFWPSVSVQLSSSYGANLERCHPAQSCPELWPRHTSDSPLDTCSWISGAKVRRPQIYHRQFGPGFGSAMAHEGNALDSNLPSIPRRACPQYK